MLDKFYKQFKSGTDIRGVASEGVGTKRKLNRRGCCKNGRRLCTLAF